MESTYINLDQITTDADTQVRERINIETVTQYAMRMEEGDDFPPVVLFRENCANYFLADGFHRQAACKECGFKSINAVVYDGNIEDARWYAIGANKTNGERLQRGDIKRAVEMALSIFLDKSQQEIADHVGCSKQYVSKVKEDVSTSGHVSFPETRKDSLGREQPTTKTRSTPKKPEKPEKEPEGQTSKEDGQDIPDSDPTALDFDNEPEVPEQVSDPSPSMKFAYKAVECLSAIPSWDDDFNEALDYVSSWILSQKRYVNS